MMSDADVLANAKSAIKSVVINLECSLGVESALPITVPLIEALNAVDGRMRAPEALAYAIRQAEGK